MKTLPVAVAHAAAVVPDLLRDAVAAWEAPWRVVVVGRTGAGKSSLVNAVIGSLVRPTGLHGVTEDPVEVEGPTFVLVDTPGLDGWDPDGVLATADAAVWVVDGLQPLTLTERQALGRTMRPDLVLHVVISRADLLDPADRADVLARVTALCARHHPRTVTFACLRGSGAEVPAALTRVEPARRLGALRAALGAARSSVPDDPPDPTAVRDVVRTRWRAAVGRAERQARADVAHGRTPDRGAAASGWALAAAAERDRLLASLAVDDRLAAVTAAIGLPVLPLPTAPVSGILGTVLGGLAGEEAAVRHIRALSGQWLAEGDAALEDWVVALSEVAPSPHELARRALVRFTLDAAVAALDDLRP